jgi:hypothetical protein
MGVNIAISLLAGEYLLPLAVLGILVPATLCFAMPTVTVCDDAVRIRFGPIGCIRREFLLADVASVAAVQNPGYWNTASAGRREGRSTT